MEIVITVSVVVAILFGLMVLGIFVTALIKTIKEFRHPKPTGFNAGVSFGGDLGIKHIKKAQNSK
jgi:hypothetical protein